MHAAMPLTPCRHRPLVFCWRIMTDHPTDAVFISDLMPQKYPEVDAGLRVVLGDRLRMILGTKDIWCRDFMPVQSAPDRFIQFRYDPDYLSGYHQLCTDNGAGLLGRRTELRDVEHQNGDGLWRSK